MFAAVIRTFRHGEFTQDVVHGYRHADEWLVNTPTWFLETRVLVPLSYARTADHLICDRQRETG